MAAKMRYMACVELTTHGTTQRASPKQPGQRALEGILQSSRHGGQTSRPWWRAFRFWTWQHTRQPVA